MNYYEMLLARKLAKGELTPNAYLLKTASGSLVSFNDGADLPMPSFICNITAQQDLHGYDGPWVGGAGKNKANLANGTRTGQGITATVADQIISASGTAMTTYANINYFNKINIISGGAYTVRLSKAVSNDITFRFATDNTDTTYQQVVISAGSTSATFTANNNFTVFRLYVSSLTSGTDVNISGLQVLVGEGDVTDFAPYSNICPISGHTGLDAWVRGKNLVDISNAVNATNVGDSVELDETIHFKDVTAQWSNTHIGKIYVVKGQTYVISASNIQYGRFGFSTSPTTHPTDSTSPNITVQSGVSPSWIIARAPTTRYFVANFTGYIYLFYCSDANYDGYHATFATQIQIELGSTATTFEPYNPQSQTISVSWQTEAGEVFGGYVDLVSGVLTVTHKSQTGFTRGSQDSTHKLYSIGFPAGMKRHLDGTISPYFIDNMFEKMSLANARASEIPSITQYNNVLYVGGYIGKETELDTLLETLQVKYELATPITYQLTPTQIKSLLGNNNAWCDTGNVTLQYFGKGDA